MNRQDCYNAFSDTMDRISKKMDQFPFQDFSPTGFCHFMGMKERMKEGINNNTFSLRKAATWLGYIQGVAVARGALTLDQVKEINKKYAND